MIDICLNEIWFITGSQHLYGPKILKKVAVHTEEIVKSLNSNSEILVLIKNKGVVTTAEEITSICQISNNEKNCIGLIFWMHTFSPAKMWINGLKVLDKPFMHLHTQFNAEIPWSKIDMDFMNLNQSAHGDRELSLIHI